MFVPTLLVVGHGLRLHRLIVDVVRGSVSTVLTLSFGVRGYLRGGVTSFDDIILLHWKWKKQQ